MKRTNFCVKANATVERPIVVDGVTYTEGERVVGWTNQTIEEATLEELRAEYTDADIANTFLRQLKQDEANAVRTDWREGGKKAEKEKKLGELTARLLAGDATAEAELKKLLLKK